MHNFLTKLFAFLVALTLRFCGGTNKASITGLDIFEKHVEHGKNIFAFWHSDLFYLTYFYTKKAPKRKISILVSMSRDGDYGVAVAKKLKQSFVRGSTSKGGTQAIRKLASQITHGNNVAITPDGPRGPAHIANDGVIRLAQLTGAQILPVAYQATKKRIFKSWDGFMLVKPFGKVHIAFAEPIKIPRRLPPEQVEEYRCQLQHRLENLKNLCAGELGLPPSDQ